MTSEESIWIDNIVSGGPDAELAFKKLTQKYGPRLYKQIIRIVKNESLTQDVLQNVFIKIWKNLSRFKRDCLCSLMKIKEKACLSILHSLR